VRAAPAAPQVEASRLICCYGRRYEHSVPSSSAWYVDWHQWPALARMRVLCLPVRPGFVGVVVTQRQSFGVRVLAPGRVPWRAAWKCRVKLAAGFLATCHGSRRAGMRIWEARPWMSVFDLGRLSSTVSVWTRGACHAGLLVFIPLGEAGWRYCRFAGGVHAISARCCQPVCIWGCASRVRRPFWYLLHCRRTGEWIRRPESLVGRRLVMVFGGELCAAAVG